MPSLCTIPNEITLLIAECLRPKDLGCFLRISHPFALLLTLVLHKLAFHDQDGLPALHWAAKQGHEPLVRLLLGGDFDQDRDHDSYANLTKQTPLMWAAERGHLNIVKLLLEDGAEIDERCDTDNCNTALLCAIKQCNVAVARLLLLNGADPNTPDIPRWKPHSTALHLAVRYEPANETMIEMLLESGANINARDNQGRTVLYELCERRRDRCSAARQLLKAGIDVNALSTELETVLHVVATRGLVDLSQVLVDYGADIEVSDRDGNRALHLAASRNHDGVEIVLVEAGADITARNMNGRTPLDYVNDEELIPVLISLSEDFAKRQEKPNGSE